MPAARARSVGALNALGSMIGTAMALAFAAIAAFIALTISATSEVAEPVHWWSQPSSRHASSMPYCVGTKNGLVVTWLTNTKRQRGRPGNGSTSAAFTRAPVSPPPASKPIAEPKAVRRNIPRRIMSGLIALPCSSAWLAMAVSSSVNFIILTLTLKPSLFASRLSSACASSMVVSVWKRWDQRLCHASTPH
jgi:hypothetical protein